MRGFPASTPTSSEASVRVLPALTSTEATEQVMPTSTPSEASVSVISALIPTKACQQSMSDATVEDILAIPTADCVTVTKVY